MMLIKTLVIIIKKREVIHMSYLFNDDGWGGLQTSLLEELSVDKLILQINYLTESAELDMKKKELYWSYHEASSDEMMSFYEAAEDSLVGKITETAKKAWKKLHELFVKLKEMITGKSKEEQLKSSDRYIGEKGTNKKLKIFNTSLTALKSALHNLRKYIGKHKAVLAFLAAAAALIPVFRRIKKDSNNSVSKYDKMREVVYGRPQLTEKENSKDIQWQNMQASFVDGNPNAKELCTDEYIKTIGGVRGLCEDVSKLLENPSDYNKDNIEVIKKIQSAISRLVFMPTVRKDANAAINKTNFYNQRVQNSNNVKEKNKYNQKAHLIQTAQGIKSIRDMSKIFSAIPDKTIKDVAMSIKPKEKEQVRNQKDFKKSLDSKQRDAYRKGVNMDRDAHIARIMDAIKGGEISISDVLRKFGLYQSFE